MNKVLIFKEGDKVKLMSAVSGTSHTGGSFSRGLTDGGISLLLKVNCVGAGDWWTSNKGRVCGFFPKQ